MNNKLEYFNMLEAEKYPELKQNIQLYVKYLRALLKDRFKNLTIHDYNVNLISITDGSVTLYNIILDSDEFNNKSYTSIMSPKLKDLYEMEGVIDLGLSRNARNRILLIYNIEYFKNSEIFESLNIVNKFNL